MSNKVQVLATQLAGKVASSRKVSRRVGSLARIALAACAADLGAPQTEDERNGPFAQATPGMAKLSCSLITAAEAAESLSPEVRIGAAAAKHPTLNSFGP